MDMEEWLVDGHGKSGCLECWVWSTEDRRQCLFAWWKDGPDESLSHWFCTMFGRDPLTDEWWACCQALPEFGYKHYTVNHSLKYVNADTGCHKQHIGRAWKSYKETIWRLRGNRTEDLLRDHLIMIEWNEWLGKKHYNGPWSLLHDIAKQYK